MTDKRHVLIVDEDREARGTLASHLERHGLRVTAASTGAGMIRALERARIDLVVLDAGLREDALRLCRGLRASHDVPVIMVARHPDAVDRIVGLEMGAEDLLAKPVNPREIVARIRNILHRVHGASRAAAGRAYLFGGWRLDIVARELCDSDGRSAALSGADFRVLATLLAHGNAVVTREKLVDLARGRDAAPHDRSIDVRVSRLRQILGDDARQPRIIKTVHGEGYVIGVVVERK
jgi:two-component system OmpR family response regulator